MYQRQIRSVVAAIVLGGHLLVFLAAMALGFFGPLRGTDLVQVVLMASPVLAITATAAIRWVLEEQTSFDQGQQVTAIFSAVVIVFPWC